MNLYKTKLKLYFYIYSKSTGGAPEFNRYHYLLSFRICENLYETKLKLYFCIYSKSTGGAPRVRQISLPAKLQDMYESIQD